MPGRAREDKTPINGELVKAGGFGKFQWFCVITMIFGQLSGGFLAHGVAYLELPPQWPGYLCSLESDPTNFNTECAPKPHADDPPFPYFCDEYNSFGIADYKVDYTANSHNLYNLYTTLSLCCKPKRATALIAMFVFAGSAIACLFMPRLGDLKGRKVIFCFSLLFQVPLLGALVFLSSLKIVYAAAFFFGICVVGRMACGFLLMMELVPTAN